VNRKDLEARLRDATWPTPSPQLRLRVLQSAPVCRPIGWIDRLSFSPGLRAIAIAAVAIVTAGHWAGARPLPASSSAIAREVSKFSELIRDVGLPGDAAAVLAERTVRRRVAAARPATSAVAALLDAGERGQ
jgi:hypothetical protein